MSFQNLRPILCELRSRKIPCLFEKEYFDLQHDLCLCFFENSLNSKQKERTKDSKQKERKEDRQKVIRTFDIWFPERNQSRKWCDSLIEYEMMQYNFIFSKFYFMICLIATSLFSIKIVKPKIIGIMQISFLQLLMFSEIGHYQVQYKNRQNTKSTHAFSHLGYHGFWPWHPKQAQI